MWVHWYVMSFRLSSVEVNSSARRMKYRILEEDVLTESVIPLLPSYHLLARSYETFPPTLSASVRSSERKISDEQTVMQMALRTAD